MAFNSRRRTTSSSGAPGAPSSPAGEPSAYQRALGLLVRREHSRKELARKLSAKGLAREEVEPALDVLLRQDFQNDERFAAAFARSRAAAGYGPARIRAELATHALPRELVAQALEACERDWDAEARDLARRRFGARDLGDPGQRRRALDFLVRRGFDPRSAQAALRSLGASAGEDPAD